MVKISQYMILQIICEFWQVNDRQSPIVGVLLTIYNDFYRLIRLYITRCHCLKKEILVKFQIKSCVIRFAIDI